MDRLRPLECFKVIFTAPSWCGILPSSTTQQPEEKQSGRVKTQATVPTRQQSPSHDTSYINHWEFQITVKLSGCSYV
jgi:hypothetical protein